MLSSEIYNVINQSKHHNNIDCDHLKILTAINRRSLIAVRTESHKSD